MLCGTRLLRAAVKQSLPSSTTKHNYVTHKEFRKANSVLKQDEEKIRIYDFPPSGRTDRRVYVWGLSVSGALGVHQNLKKLQSRNAHIVHHPTRQPFGERYHIIDVACGYGFSLFACKPDENGTTLFGTGLNTDSQIGYHKLGGKLHKPMLQMVYPAPIQLSATATDAHVKKVAAGRSHSVALTGNGDIYTLGNNAFGQCGRTIIEEENFANSQTINRLPAQHFGVGDRVSDIVCGQDHTLFRTASGRVFACGWGADGQTGQGHYNNVDVPTLVGGDIAGENIVKVASTVDCVLAINGSY